MLTISNLSHMKRDLLPSFMGRFESMYGISTAADRETLDEVVEQLDKILFDDFIKRKSESLLEITEKGISGDGLAWAEGSKPTGESVRHMTQPSLAIDSLCEQASGHIFSRICYSLCTSTRRSMASPPVSLIGFFKRCCSSWAQSCLNV